jgi:hypothetical protein
MKLSLILLTCNFIFAIYCLEVGARGESRMLLLLAAPSTNRGYYRDYFNNIVNFQIEYVQKVLDGGADDIVIIVNENILPYYSKRLPANVLLIDDMGDIWMRDFTLVSPHNPVRFVYTWASMTEDESVETQQSFDDFAKYYGLQYKKAPYYFRIDGGNIVDTFDGKVLYLISLNLF